MDNNIFVTAVSPTDQRSMFAYLGSTQDLLMFDSTKHRQYAKIKWDGYYDLREAWRSAMQPIMSHISEGRLSHENGVSALKELGARLLPPDVLQYHQGSYKVGEYFHDVCEMLKKHPNLCHPILCRDYLPQDKAENFIHNLAISMNLFHTQTKPITTKSVRQKIMSSGWRIYMEIVNNPQKFGLSLQSNHVILPTTHRGVEVSGHYNLELNHEAVRKMFANRYSEGVFTKDRGGDYIFTFSPYFKNFPK